MSVLLDVFVSKTSSSIGIPKLAIESIAVIAPNKNLMINSVACHWPIDFLLSEQNQSLYC